MDISIYSGEGVKLNGPSLEIFDPKPAIQVNDGNLGEGERELQPSLPYSPPVVDLVIVPWVSLNPTFGWMKY